MYQREFDQRLRQAFSKAVLLYGENVMLFDKIPVKISKANIA